MGRPDETTSDAEQSEPRAATHPHRGTATRALAVVAAASPPRHPSRLRRAVPYLLGAAMFAVAAWILHGALGRFHPSELRAELARLSGGQVGLAVLFTGLSFVALVGYEWSSLRLIGRRVPLRQLSLASFITQSIAHSTGFAFVIGATLRYQLYASRGLTVLDVAKIQVCFTATFTLGISTLAGAVLLLQPHHLAAVSGLPPWAWRLGAATALAVVAGYVVWGAFFHRPFRFRGNTYAFPDAGSTLTQIFFGVADLLAVAAALHVLLPAGLGLSYVEVLAIFMASIVTGLMSHVPGSLGVFESAVLLLVQPPPDLVLPVVGALLAFRACYYLLPLLCGVALLAVYELVRWRRILARPLAGLALRARPFAPPFAAALAATAGVLLLLATSTPVPEARAERLAALPGSFPGAGNLLCSGLGVSLLVLARGLALRAAAAWGCGLVLLLAGTAVCLATGESVALWAPLVLALAVLLAGRREFVRPSPDLTAWFLPGWLALISGGVLLAAFFLARG